MAGSSGNGIPAFAVGELFLGRLNVMLTCQFAFGLGVIGGREVFGRATVDQGDLSRTCLDHLLCHGAETFSVVADPALLDLILLHKPTLKRGVGKATGANNLDAPARTKGARLSREPRSVTSWPNTPAVLPAKAPSHKCERRCRTARKQI